MPPPSPHPLPPRRQRRWPSLAFVVLVALAACSEPAPKSAVDCPQHRATERAPEAFLSRVNPLPRVQATTQSGARLYEAVLNGPACLDCHGRTGDGHGPLSAQFDPPPRNFTCADTVRDIPDGQLFWIIRFGSPGTAMPAHPHLRDEQVWQIVAYLRELAK